MTLFAVASNWETITEEERMPLRTAISKLVGYQCKLSCQPNHGSVDIYIFSLNANRITDWIEIQPSGALGALFDLYPAHAQPNRLSDACEDYNESRGVEFESDSDESDGDNEEEGEGEGELEESDDNPRLRYD